MKSLNEYITAKPEETRVANFIKNFRMTARNKINEMIMKYNNLQNKIDSSLDFGPTDSNDLYSSLKNVSPENIVKTIFDTSLEMEILHKEIQHNVKVYNKLFPEDPIDITKEISGDFI